MRRLAPILLCASFACLFAAEPPAPPVSKVLDGTLSMAEREIVPLAEAMPEDKFQFKPSGGETGNSRTFAQQVAHIAAVIHSTAAAVLEEPIPNPGPGENGPATLKTKADFVKYLKDAFAHGHKALASLTPENLTQPVKSAFGPGTAPRLGMANVAIWHSFDHYGQMAVYARLAGIVPPASRQ